jgi:toxin ParE1/3/4
MSYSVGLLREAILELEDAQTYYNERSRGVGDRLVRAVDTALAAIANNPFRFQVVRRSYRKAVLSSFPYVIFFRVEDGLQAVIVAAIVHGKRDPSWINRRLS